MKGKLKFIALTSCFLGLIALSTKKLVVNAESESDDKVIEAFAHYEFKDATNPGKDSSKHGFDLKKKSTSGSAESFQVLDDGGDSYVSIRRDQYDTGKSKGTGSYLYAPQIGKSSYDFSDMITGSYTVSMTFRADNSIGFGDVYALSFGRYGSCFTVVPWSNRIEIQLNNLEFAPGETNAEKQVYVEQNRSYYSYNTSDWTNLTVSANADNNKYSIYINSSLIDEVEMPGVKLTSSAYDDYTFTLGAQANIYGESATQFGNVDFKDVAIYDCALTSENITEINNGSEAKLSKQGTKPVYVKSIEKLDETELDLQVTDVNTVTSLIESGLPRKAKVSLSNDVNRLFNVFWYPVVGEQKIKGYVQTGSINPDLIELEVNYNYAVKFEYDDKLVSVSEVKLDNVDYVPGSAIDSNKHLLTFKVSLLNGSELNSVTYLDMDWDVDTDDLYYIDIAEGALINIDAVAATYEVTYMFGDETLGTSEYTAGGSEALKEFNKDGYVFEGWYTDKELTTKFEALDYENPEDLTLYGKYSVSPTSNPDQQQGNNDAPKKKGCNGESLPSLLGGLLVLGVLGFVVYSRKKKYN